MRTELRSPVAEVVESDNIVSKPLANVSDKLPKNCRA